MFVRSAFTLLLATLLFAAVFPVTAQRNPVWTSLDLRVADADEVVIGRIAELGPHTGDGRQTPHEQPVVIAVEETLKGDPVGRLSLVLNNDTWIIFDRLSLLCADCAAKDHRLLLIVRRAVGGPSNGSVIDLDGNSILDVSADLQVLTTALSVMKDVREEIRRQHNTVHTEAFGLGPTKDFMVGTSFRGCTIVVPADERLEKRALNILEHQVAATKVIDPYDNERAESVMALEHFRSPQNIELLKKLLSDPERVHAAVGRLDYAVREAAYNVLQKWGVAVAKPVTVEILPNDS